MGDDAAEDGGEENREGEDGGGVLHLGERLYLRLV